MTLSITGATILTPHERVEDGTLVIQDGHIAELGPARQVSPQPQAETFDATGLLLAPGFIDLQINGAYGHDFTADPTTIWPVAEALPRFGVTAFLPTIVTSPLEQITAGRRALAQGRPTGFRGAEPLGLHLEGPFLNPVKRGAHNPAYLRRPDLEAAQEWSPAAGVRLVTLAPELPGALALVEALTERGVVVSAGHSMATLADARAGCAMGIRYGTHLFNAMSALEHREPGLPGALLADPRCIVGLIPDGIHVHGDIIRIIWAVKGSRGVNLVSDAMGALGMPAGRYRLHDFEVIVSQTDARLADGRLAGSVLPLDQAVRNLIAYTGCRASEAIATVTEVPADLLGMGDQRGRLRVGMIADMVLLTPQLEVVMTIAAGDVVYRR